MPDSNISLKEAFGIQQGEVVSLVGAGGKTMLMATLAKELAVGETSVITTTTTKILEWQAPSEKLIIEDDVNRMLELTANALQQHQHITLSSRRLPDIKKLDSVSPQTIDKLAELTLVDYIIVEADGAGRKSLKAPNATEPVIPPSTTLVIAVVGIDALNKKLNWENVFRPELVSKLTGLAIGETVTTNAVATLIVHDEGIAKGSPKTARIIPFINKVDTREDIIEAEKLAKKILKAGRSCIRRVVLGRLQSEKPVVSMIDLP
jgi:probable selenium-dependent hydroxylase accessory protein YqeC